MPPPLQVVGAQAHTTEYETTPLTKCFIQLFADSKYEEFLHDTHTAHVSQDAGAWHLSWETDAMLMSNHGLADFS